MTYKKKVNLTMLIVHVTVIDEFSVHNSSCEEIQQSLMLGFA